MHNKRVCSLLSLLVILALLVACAPAGTPTASTGENPPVTGGEKPEKLRVWI